jgi:hypothetical protein
MNEDLKRTDEEWEEALAETAKSTEDWIEVRQVNITMQITVSLRTNHTMVAALSIDDPEGLMETAAVGMKTVLDSGFTCANAGASWGQMVPVGEALMLLSDGAR